MKRRLPNASTTAITNPCGLEDNLGKSDKWDGDEEQQARAVG